MDCLKEDIDPIPPVVKKFMRVFVDNEQQASTITALLEKFDCVDVREKSSCRRLHRSSKGDSETNATAGDERMVTSDGAVSD